MQNERFVKVVNKWVVPIIWGVIFVCAIALRVLYMDQPMRYDESYTYNNLAARNLPTVLSDYFQPNNHIFHSLLVYITVGILGSAPWVIRLPALLAGLACVFAQYRLTRLFYGHWAGLLAAFLIAFSLPVVEFSANARGYTLITLFTALLFMEAKLLKDDEGQGRWWRYGLWCVLGLYTIPVMLYAVGGASLWLLLSLWRKSSHAERLGRLFQMGGTLAVAAVATVVLYTPVFFNTGLDSLIGNEFVARLDPATFVATLPETLLDLFSVPNEGFTLPLVVILVAGMGLALLRHSDLSEDKLSVLPAFLVFILIMLLVQQVQPFPRTWIILIPPYLMLASAGIVKLLENRAWLIVPVIALVLYSAFDYIQSETILNSDRTGNIPGAAAAANYLHDVLEPEDRILAIVPADEPTKYYLNRLGTEGQADQIVNQFQITQDDLLTSGTLYMLGKITTAPEITDELDISQTALTLQLAPIAQFDTVTLQAAALEPVRSNTTLFVDSFETATLPGWLATEVVTAADGSVVRLQTGEEWGIIALNGGDEWQDYRVTARVRILEQNPDFEAFYLSLRHSGQGRYVATLNIENDVVGISWEEGEFWHGFLEQASMPLSSEAFYDVTLQAVENDLQLFINGRSSVTLEADLFERGSIRLALPPLTQVLVDHVEVAAVTPDSLDGPEVP